MKYSPFVAFSALACTALLTLSPCASADVKSMSLLQAGDVAVEDLPKELDHWFGLYQMEEAFIVSAISISVEPYFHEAANTPEEKEDKGAWSGRLVKAQPLPLKERRDQLLSEPLLLIRSTTLRPGPVETSFPGHGSSEYRETGSFAPLQSISMNLGDKSYQIDGSFGGETCRLSLRNVGLVPATSKRLKDQVIFDRMPDNLVKFPEGVRKVGYIPGFCGQGWTSYPKLVWAGDLDRDSKIDLILDQEHDSTYSRYLLLSSAADKGEQVKLIGHFTRPSGC